MAIELMTSWPALALLITIFFGSSLVFQDYTSKSIRGTSTTASLGSWLKRTGDIEWWMQIALPMYALHQFEEYGLDLYGRHYAFHETMCTTLGFSSMLTCPITAWHLAFINFVLVLWASVRGRPAGAAPGAGANFYGLGIANGLLHTGVGLSSWSKGAATWKEVYNPGIATAALLLFPAGIGALRTMYKRGVLSGYGVARSLVIGVLFHVVLQVGLFARSREYMNDIVFVVYMTTLFYVAMLPTWPH